MNSFSSGIRSSIFLLGQSISTIFFSLTGLLLFFCPYIIRYRYITAWSYFVIWWAKSICGIQYHVSGLENLPNHNAIVFCKHQSAWETLFLQTLLPPQCWVLKRELLWIPFFGWGLKLLEPIAIDRKKSSSLKQLISQGKERLQQGRWIVIFPEGTRVNVGASSKYSRSAAVLAKESGYPLMPIAHNAGICWPKDALLKKAGTIELVIGPAIDPTALTVDEIHQQAQNWVEDAMRKLPQET